jgi:hypothetical protein
MTSEEMKKQIDNMTYEKLLSCWRYAPTGSPYFRGEVGEYYKEVMKKKRAGVGILAHIAASKRIG